MGITTSKNTTAITRATSKVKDVLNKYNQTDISTNVINTISVTNVSGSKLEIKDIIQSADSKLIMSVYSFLELNKAGKVDIMSNVDMQAVLSSSLTALSGDKVNFRVENYTSSDISFITDIFSKTTTKITAMNEIIVNNITNSEVLLSNIRQSATSASEILIEDTASSLSNHGSEISAQLRADLQTAMKGVVAEVSGTVQASVKEISSVLDNTVSQVGTALNTLSTGAADAVVVTATNVSEGANTMLNTTKYFLIGGAIVLVVLIVIIGIVAVNKQKTAQVALTTSANGYGRKKTSKRKKMSRNKKFDDCGCEDGYHADSCNLKKKTKSKNKKK